MARDRFTKGSKIRIQATFSDPTTKALQNCDTVTLDVRSPDETVAPLSFTNISTGVYEAILPLAQLGTYFWHWTGVKGSNEQEVIEGSCDSYVEVDF